MIALRVLVLELVRSGFLGPSANQQYLIATSELFGLRPKIDLVAPGSDLLMRNLPIDLGDSIGRQHATGIDTVTRAVGCRVDDPIEDNMHDMNALWLKFPRERLCQSPQRKFCRLAVAPDTINAPHPA
jgi:hypothetical protein